LKPGGLTQEPDARAVRTGWLAWTTWGVIGGALLFEDWKLSATSFHLVLTAPFWALWLLWPLWRLATRLRHLAWANPRAGWQARHYEFDGRRMRVHFVEERCLLEAEDVFEVLEAPAAARRPERVRVVAGPEGVVELEGGRLAFTEAGLAAWLARRRDPRALALAQWFEHEVAAPRRRRIEAGLPEAQP
jgi:hypothetical protein